MFRDHFSLASRPAGALGLVGAVLLTVGLAGSPVHAVDSTVGLGSAGSFAVLARRVGDEPGTWGIPGDVGVGSETSVTSVPRLVIVDGALHVARRGRQLGAVGPPDGVQLRGWAVDREQRAAAIETSPRRSEPKHTANCGAVAQTAGCGQQVVNWFATGRCYRLERAFRG
jgi:hypothetical protein